MTNDELSAIERRANEATKGPWEQWDHRGKKGRSHIYPYEEYDLAPAHGVIVAGINCTIFQRREDDAFVAHAIFDIPALIAEVRRLQEVLEFISVCDHHESCGCAKAADKAIQ